MSSVSYMLHRHSTTHFECYWMRFSIHLAFLNVRFFHPFMALIAVFGVCIFFALNWVENDVCYIPELAFVKYGCIIKATIVTKFRKTECRISEKMNSLKSNTTIWSMTFFPWIIRLYWRLEWIFGKHILKK